MAPGNPVHIRTNGFILRSLTPADVTPRFLAWLTSKEMVHGLNLGELKFDMEGLRRFVASFDNLHNYLIGIFDEKTRLLVGFYTIDVNLPHKIGQLTTGVGEPEYAGKATLWATIDALLDYLYAHRDLEKLSARVLAKNYRMLFNFKDNTRFVLEGCLEQECRTPTGERLDLLIFSSFKTPVKGKRSATLPQASTSI